MNRLRSRRGQEAGPCVNWGSRTASLLLIFWLPLWLCGCHSVHYRDLVVPILRTGLVDPREGQIVVRQVDAKNGQPASNVVVSILSAQHPLQLRTDAQGIMRLPLVLTYLEENPRPKHNHRGRLTVNFTSTAAFSFGTNEHQETVALHDKFTLTNESVIVYYPVGLGTAARETLRELQRGRDFLAQSLGIPPRPWGVVLPPEKRTNVDYVVTGTNPGRQVWSYAVAELQSGRLAQINTHEWTEQTLDPSLGLYEADRRSRFIGDGLAEWMAWRHAGLPENYTKNLESLVQEKKTKVDLLRQLQSIHGGRMSALPSSA
jgi:hypothetical protein